MNTTCCASTIHWGIDNPMTEPFIASDLDSSIQKKR